MKKTFWAVMMVAFFAATCFIVPTANHFMQANPGDAGMIKAVAILTAFVTVGVLFWSVYKISEEC